MQCSDEEHNLKKLLYNKLNFKEMKKIIFNGYLANDEDCFVELSICSYDFKMDGNKQSYIYVAAFEISKSFPLGNLSTIESANDLVNYVHAQQMCESDVELLIKNINKYPFDSIAAFGNESETHLTQRLREVEYEDD